MADVFSPQKRSAIMARVRSVNTKPEVIVRKLVHSLGYRFRIHQRTLPGKPDVVLARHRKVIFVHGCFWHGHSQCARATLPATNVMFWRTKISSNKVRDKKVQRRLSTEGWRILVVWQCQTHDLGVLSARLQRFLKEEAN